MNFTELDCEERQENFSKKNTLANTQIKINIYKAYINSFKKFADFFPEFQKQDS